MKSKKILTGLLAGTMTLSLVACGGEKEEQPATAEVSTQTAQAEEKNDGDAQKQENTEQEAASVDFEDGSLSFLSLYTQAANADNSELSIVDYNGSKALLVKNVDGKTPYVAFDISSMLGADVAKVASIEMTIGTEHAGGKFSAVSGNIVSWAGEDLAEYKDAWSVYIDSKNPNKAIAKVAAGEEFIADAGNIIMVTIDTDNGVSEGNGNANLYIDNIRFLDAEGNVLSADTSVDFVAPKGFESSGKDLSNLSAVTKAVNFEGFALKGDGWAQNGLDMPQEILDALVPGSVVEIEYKSDNGDMWLVMPDAQAGWMRVGDGTNGKAYINDSCSIAQITYEQIAEYCGEDKSTWGARMQAEASGAWEVFSVKVGQKAPVYAVSNAVELEGFAKKADAWAQDGVDLSQEVIDALVPGSVVELDYTSESGNLWIVMPDAQAGWMRVGDGNNGSSVCVNGKCYITYEQIAEYCGEDKSTWGTRLQAESDSAWEVYGARVGTASEMKMVNNNVNFEGFATKADAWAQNGFDMPQEILDALVPGSVVTLKYTSESGKLWIVMPDAQAGWMRVGDGTNGTAACNNGYCQITYEQIAEYCGEDKSTWGARLQAEADTPWEVYSVAVGQSVAE